MRLSVFFVCCLWFALWTSQAARAELRDVSFAAEAETAKILFTFEGQPSAVKVFITEHGLDVDILGIDLEKAEFFPAEKLFRSVRQIPAPGGVRIRSSLSDIPLAANAEVFEGAVLVTAHFSHSIDYGKTPMPVQIIAHTPKAAITADPKPELEKKLEPATDVQTKVEPAPVEDFERSGHDGEPAQKRVPLPKKAVGAGMIREASIKVAGSLSEEQCSASETAVEEDPWALDNLARFGACLAREGKAKEAREVFERLITFDPETFAAYIGLGAIAQDAGDAQMARQYYEEALALGGADAEAAQARALLGSLGEE